MSCLNRMIGSRYRAVALAVTFFSIGELAAAPADEFDRLLQAPVSSAAKLDQPLADVPAAVAVISSEDIRRAGVTNLPDALRLAPGVEVSRINASTYAISIRGFSSTYAHKTLVMIDGRSIYTPFYGGVFWDAHLPLLENIDRIEIVRGPSGHLWGANAVNGIINIITRPANLSQQPLLVVGGGLEETFFVRGRSTGRVGEAYLRHSFSYRERDDSGTLPDENLDQALEDGQKLLQMGSQLDWLTSRNLDVTLRADVTLMEKGFNSAQSDIATALFGAPGNTNQHREGSLGAQVVQDFDGNIYTFRTAYTALERRDIFYQMIHTSFELDYQYDITSLPAHQVSLGLQYRMNRDRVDGSVYVSLRDEDIRTETFSGFIQDIWSLGAGFDLVSGLRFEKHTLDSTSLMPTLKLLWQTDQFSAWLSAAKANRTPSLLDQFGNAQVDTNPRTERVIREAFDLPDMPVVLRALGNEDFKAEQLDAWEAGVRWQPLAEFYVDLSGFRYDYEYLRTYEFTGYDVQDELTFVDISHENEARGTTTGAELFFKWRPSMQWRVAGHLSYWDVDVKPLPGSTGLGANVYELLSPDWMAGLHSYHDIGDRWQVMWAVRYLRSVPGSPIESYTAFDTKLQYQWRPDIALALVGRDLGGPPRYEHRDQLLGPPYTKVRGSLYGQLEWRL